MNYAREYCSSIVFNGEMVVVGGYSDRDGWLDSVEKKVRLTIDCVSFPPNFYIA